MTSISIQSSHSLVAIGLGYLIFGSILSALLFMLDLADTDKDVDYSQDHGQYWLGIPTVILGIYILIARNQMSDASKYVRLFMSVYCFITSTVCIVLEAPDWMRYLSDNRSPDTTCKLAMIAVPGLHQEMENSESFCSRRTSYAWAVGFVMVSSVFLINFSICSTLVHAWLTVKEKMAYKMPDYPAFTSYKDEKVLTTNQKNTTGSSNKGFEENYD